MLRVKLLFVERIHPKTDKFATGVEGKGTRDLKVNDRALTSPSAEKMESAFLGSKCLIMRFSR